MNMVPHFQIHIHICAAVFRNQFFGNVAPGRSQPAAGNDNISTSGSNVQNFFHAYRIISHRCLIQNVKTTEIQFLRQPGKVSIQNFSQKKFRTGCNDFNSQLTPSLILFSSLIMCSKCMNIKDEPDNNVSHSIKNVNIQLHIFYYMY